MLICFFVLCRNVAKINSKFTSKDRETLLSEINMHIAFNDEDRAREILKKLIWRYVEFIHKEYPTSPEVRKKKYQEIISLYGKYMDKLNIEFPDQEELSKI